MHIQEHIITNLPVFDIKDTSEKILEFFQDHYLFPYCHIGRWKVFRFISEIDADGLLPDSKIERL